MVSYRHRRGRELTEAEQAILDTYKVAPQLVEVTRANGEVVKQMVPVKVYPMLHEQPTGETT